MELKELVMLRKLASLLMILSLLGSAVNVHAQQSESPEDAQIKQYRAEISVLTSQLPPAEAQAAHAAALVALRRKLRDLLIERRGGLKRDIQVLRSQESHEYVARLEAVISSITTEVNALDEALPQNSPVDIANVSQ